MPTVPKVSFKLLHIPFINIIKVFKQMNILELLDLSQTSKKVRILISLSGTQEYEVILDCRPRYITVKTPGKSYNINLEKTEEDIMNIGTVLRNNVCTDEKLTLIWKKHWATLLFHIIRVFKCPVTAFYTGSFLSLNAFQLIMNFIMRRQSEIQQLHIRKYDLEERFLLKILKKLEVKDSLFLNSNILSSNFQYNYSTNSISFWSCKWFTLNSLLASNSVSIDLLGSSLTNEDMNEFLMRWEEGEYQNLEYLSIGSGLFTDDVPILEMMPPIKNDNSLMISKTVGTMTHFIRGGVKIEGHNGKIGWIKFAKGDGLSPNLLKLSLIIVN